MRPLKKWAVTIFLAFFYIHAVLHKKIHYQMLASSYLPGPSPAKYFRHYRA